MTIMKAYIAFQHMLAMMYSILQACQSLIKQQENDNHTHNQQKIWQSGSLKAIATWNFMQRRLNSMLQKH